ncbi:MAG: enoyl-CoA hydratase/isomerase [Actinomycetia bacterium]|nr:enoyl-CoA hydratase/isomerase [Actinomycetes bacterium]
MVDPLCITVAELAGGALPDPPLDATGQVRVPLLAVNLDDHIDAATLKRALAYTHSGDRLLVGVAGNATGPLPPHTEALARALDLTLVGPSAVVGREGVTVADPERHLATLHAAVLRNPQASVVLGGVLRMTESLPVPAALDAESLAYSTLLGGTEFHRWLTARGPRPEPPLVDDPVLIDRRGDHLLITLNRPERRNAYGRQVRDALVEALRLALLDHTIDRVVLDGAGPSFCSGGDLDEFGTTPDLTTAHLVRTRAGAGRLVHDLAGRIQVRVHGSCVGAGIELPAFAGTLVADPGTTFRLPELGMGLIPGAGGTVSIPRRIGRWRTLYLALTGATVDAPTALGWGLIDEVTPYGQWTGRPPD